VEDEHIKERGLIVELDVDGEKVKQFASPIAFSKTKQEYKFAGKKIGEDTEEILKNLGYSEDKIKELKDLDVFK
jgi:alpha-methylacyl-CoA racemase